MIAFGEDYELFVFWGNEGKKLFRFFYWYGCIWLYMIYASGDRDFLGKLGWREKFPSEYAEWPIRPHTHAINTRKRPQSDYFVQIRILAGQVQCGSSPQRMTYERNLIILKSLIAEIV